ncbi:hypothetical protein ACFOLF_19405 [Paenibacillus sepulcri]|uniref:CvpA family protein n=1 Tax=Paenibacillus sepulcri TaxID=359917 RepID=A0ABS7C254_9BACL|nr:hypothetical protein [Paenibacillus sepulcri]
MIVCGVVVVMGIIIGIRIWTQLIQEKTREAVWAIAVLTLGVAYSCVVILKIPMPNPVDVIDRMTEPVYRVVLEAMGITPL